MSFQLLETVLWPGEALLWLIFLSPLCPRLHPSHLRGKHNFSLLIMAFLLGTQSQLNGEEQSIAETQLYLRGGENLLRGGVSVWVFIRCCCCCCGSVCLCKHASCTCVQADSLAFLISAVRRPPIVGYDPLSRPLPKELYLLLPVITAHKEQHVMKMSYLSAPSTPA